MSTTSVVGSTMQLKPSSNRTVYYYVVNILVMSKWVLAKSFSILDAQYNAASHGSGVLFGPVTRHVNWCLPMMLQNKCLNKWIHCDFNLFAEVSIIASQWHVKGLFKICLFRCLCEAPSWFCLQLVYLHT